MREKNKKGKASIDLNKNLTVELIEIAIRKSFCKRDLLLKYIRDKNSYLYKIATSFYAKIGGNYLNFVNIEDVIQDYIEIVIKNIEKWDDRYDINQFLEYCKWYMLNRYNSYTPVGMIPRNVKVQYIMSEKNKDSNLKIIDNDNIKNYMSVAESIMQKDINDYNFYERIYNQAIIEEIIDVIRDKYGKIGVDIVETYFGFSSFFGSLREVATYYGKEVKKIYKMKNKIIEWLRRKYR